jgi:hypothetical protein
MVLHLCSDKVSRPQCLWRETLTSLEDVDALTICQPSELQPLTVGKPYADDIATNVRPFVYANGGFKATGQLHDRILKPFTRLCLGGHTNFSRLGCSVEAAVCCGQAELNGT